MVIKMKNYDAMLLKDSSFKNSDIFYATQFSAPDPFIFIKTKKGKKIIVVTELEYGRALKTAKVDKVLLDENFVKREEFKSQLTKKNLAYDFWRYDNEVIDKVLKQYKAKNILVPPDFAYKSAKLLEEKGYKLIYKESNPFFPEREVKTKKEIKYITETQRINEEAMEAAINAIRNSEIKGNKLYLDNEPLTTERVKNIIHMKFLEHDCLPLDGSIVSCGDQCCDPHNSGSGVLKANQTIIIDIYPKSMKHGYWADMTRTVVKGKASKKVKEIYQAVIEAKELAKSEIKEGVIGSKIYYDVLKMFEDKGFPKKESKKGSEGFIHGVGHSLGLDIHELPSISKGDTELKAGNVVTVEPGLYYYGIGGIRQEDIVVVTKKGCKTITKYPEILEIE